MRLVATDERGEPVPQCGVVNFLLLCHEEIYLHSYVSCPMLVCKLVRSVIVT